LKQVSEDAPEIWTGPVAEYIPAELPLTIKQYVKTTRGNGEATVSEEKLLNIGAYNEFYLPSLLGDHQRNSGSRSPTRWARSPPEKMMTESEEQRIVLVLM
jgi:hypothetical protein